jgi:hypothetical protein
VNLLNDFEKQAETKTYNDSIGPVYGKRKANLKVKLTI